MMATYQLIVTTSESITSVIREIQAASFRSAIGTATRLAGTARVGKKGEIVNIRVERKA